MLVNDDDEKIIAEYLNSRDEELFRILLDRYTKPVYNFIRSMVGKTGEAEDITQEVFVKVWKNLKKYKIGQNFKTWLFAIAKNSTIDFLRKRKVLNFADLNSQAHDRIDGDDNFDFAENIPDEAILPDEALQKLQNSDLLNKLLDQLRVEYKTVLVLHYMEEMTFDEISKMLKKPLNTVKSYHRRAILELRKMI